MYPYRISVIIPVYNAAEYLRDCLESLLAQTMRRQDFEVLMIDDGSADESADICREYAGQYPGFRFFSKENGGVSSTRNFGIEHAQGRYFLFLDADDTLTPDTLKTVADFFDHHYDEVDMVTYRIVPVWKEHRYGVHYRYRTMQKTGVYDLHDPENWYVTQTTMNICVKNLGAQENVKFDTSLAFHEDQKYNFDVLCRKMKLGFCDKPEYLYLRRPGSATGSRAYAYYIFEDTMALWEEMFARYEGGHVPCYLQALYINDLNWKTTKDILLPYHYDEERFREAQERLTRLLRRVDDAVIMNHPIMDLYLKLYLMRCKGEERLSCDTSDGIRVFCDGEEIYQSEDLSVVVNRMKVVGHTLVFDGFIKSPAFLFGGTPRIFLIEDGERRELPAEESVFSYYHARTKTSRFWRVRMDVDTDTVRRFFLEVEAFGHTFSPKYYFMANTCFKQKEAVRSFFLNGKRFTFRARRGEFRIDSGFPRVWFLPRFFVGLAHSLHYLRINAKVPVYRLLAAFRPRREIWVYQDRAGVFDNAYQQFCHDFGKPDGIERYYIINDCDLDGVSERFTPEQQTALVRFHSMKHKYLYLNCDKILTAFSNVSNICPFGIKPMRWYYDVTRFELVYLQHGILHASLQKMYSHETCQIDRVVVSSGFETENFREKYGYGERELIPSGMPRFDFMHLDAPKKNRILLSPSWRSNLIGKLVDNEREPVEALFLESDFYKEFSALLSSPRLHRLLEEKDLYLDFKNHPIFACYNHLFTPGSDRVTVSCGDTNMDDYRLMITDYSSIVFDAVYLGCPILYFVPDYDKFLAGVSHNYRALDLPLEQGFGPFTRTAEELIGQLEHSVEREFIPEEPYRSRMADFFLHREGSCMDRLYDALTQKD